MNYQCIFCGIKVKTNDASFSVNIHVEGQEKEEIVDTIFKEDICSFCANHFCKYVDIIKEYRKSQQTGEKRK